VCCNGGRGATFLERVGGGGAGVHFATIGGGGGGSAGVEGASVKGAGVDTQPIDWLISSITSLKSAAHFNLPSSFFFASWRFFSIQENEKLV
jgi:hypothetical protein